MNITFFDRLSAYVIDMIVIYIISMVISLSGLTTTSGEYTEKLENLTSSYSEKNITEKEYIEQYTDILYDNQNNNILAIGLSTGLSIAYFIVFQFLNKGQTIGKKLLGLRVVDKDKKKCPNIFKFIIRTVFIFNIFSNIVGILLGLLFSKQIYLYGYGSVVILETIFLIGTIVRMLYSKDKRGFHDVISNTMVIREGR